MLLARPVAHAADLLAEMSKVAQQETMAVKGKGQWLFLREEMLHLSKGPLMAELTTPAVTAIMQYNEALKAEGVELLVVPVPAKAEIYPDEFHAEARPDAFAGRQDSFLTTLKEAGVVVVDLAKAFQAKRAQHPEVPLYCQRDAHWTPSAMELAADLVVQAAKDPSIKKPQPPIEPKVQKLEIKGDLMTTPETMALGSEEVLVRRYPPIPQAEPSWILMGDSHTLVFSSGADSGFHCKDSGLLEMLAARTGQPLMLSANAGGGTDTARTQLARKALPHPNFWKDKKVLVWCFSIREVTEKKWKDIPIKKKG